MKYILSITNLGVDLKLECKLFEIVAKTEDEIDLLAKKTIKRIWPESLLNVWASYPIYPAPLDLIESRNGNN